MAIWKCTSCGCERPGRKPAKCPDCSSRDTFVRSKNK